MTPAKPDLPACLKAEEVAQLLGCPKHSVVALVRAGLLQPLGRPRANATKYFQKEVVIENCNNVTWLNHAMEAIRLHWQRKNQNRTAQKKSNPT